MKRAFAIALLLAHTGNGGQPPRHGPGGHSKKKWLNYTKKYTGHQCIWDSGRKDCASCSKNACPCYQIHQSRCFDCKDERICYADGVGQSSFVFWTKTESGCQCGKSKGDTSCACCYPGGRQCSGEFKMRCVAPGADLRECAQNKKIKMKVDWTKPPVKPSKTKFVKPTAVTTLLQTTTKKVTTTTKPPKTKPNKPDKPNKPPKPGKPSKPVSNKPIDGLIDNLIDDLSNNDQHNPHDHDHLHDNDVDHVHTDGDDGGHHTPDHQVALQIPIGKPQQAIIDKVMKDMDLALRKKKPSKIQQTIDSCNPNLPVYVPLFYMPQFETHSNGRVACQDPFWLSLRHGGAQTRLVVQTRREPKNVDPVEQGAMQACIDLVKTGDTTVLGYVDADFENRPMIDILDDIRAWGSNFKNMSGVYLDPIGIQLRGNHLDIMLAKITQFIRTQMKLDFSMIVYHPASDFYDF